MTDTASISSLVTVVVIAWASFGVFTVRRVLAERKKDDA